MRKTKVQDSQSELISKLVQGPIPRPLSIIFIGRPISCVQNLSYGKGGVFVEFWTFVQFWWRSQILLERAKYWAYHVKCQYAQKWSCEFMFILSI